MSTGEHVSRTFVYQALTWVGLAALAVVLLLVGWHGFEILLLIFAGVLFGIFLYSLSAVVAAKLPLGYRWSLALVTFLLLVLLIAGLVYLVPQIIQQVSQLASQLDQAVTQLRERLQNQPWGQEVLGRMPKLGELFLGQTDLMSIVRSVFQTAFGFAVNLVVIFFVGLYAAATPEVYRQGLLALVPPARRPRASDVLSDVRITLWRWILGRLFSMTVIGIFTALGLWLLGIPLPITLGVITALLTFVPNIGPVLSVIPPLLLSFQQGPWMPLYVVILYLVLQLVESYLLTPLVQRREVALPPALIISVQVLLGVLAGAFGLALATPLAALVLVLVVDLYIRDVLHDHEGVRLPHEK